MLSERLREHSTRCYLINTGWSGGAYGVGSRIDLEYTRQMVRAGIEGKLDNVETYKDPFFALNVPRGVPGVPSEILNPRQTWEDKEAYDEQAGKLADLFKENFTKFESSREIREAGPCVTTGVQAGDDKRTVSA